MTTHLPFPKWALSLLIIAGVLLAPAQEAKAGYPVIDTAHIATSVKNLANSVAHKVEDAINWMAQIKEAVSQTLFLEEIFMLSEFMRSIQDEIMRGLGTVEDIISIPSHIMSDLFGMIGSVKDTIMDVAGVAGVWEDIQGVFGGISEIEAFGRSFSGGLEDPLDFGKFGNAFGAMSAIRGVQTRTAIEYLNPTRMANDQRSVERIIDTFENSSNAAEIAKGNAELNAAIHRQVSRANEFQAMDIQRRTSESWAREEEARSRAATSNASTYEHMLNFLD